MWCDQCGECCSQMGLVYQVRRKGSPYEFSLTNRYTGEKSTVTVDPDKIHLFEADGAPRSMEQCPFLRFDDGSGKTCCIIYLTRPEVCSEFYCSRIHIFAGEKKLGRVMGSRHLCTDDAWLRKFWNAQVTNLQDLDELKWIDEAARLMMNAGYIVRR